MERWGQIRRKKDPAEKRTAIRFPPCPAHQPQVCCHDLRAELAMIEPVPGQAE